MIIFCPGNIILYLRNMKPIDRIKLKALVKASFESSIAAVLFLALIQPFGIDRMQQGRLFYLFVIGIIIFCTGLFSSLIASLIVRRIARDRYDEPRYGYLCLFFTFVINVPIMAFVLAHWDAYFFSEPFTRIMYVTFLKWIALLALFIFVWQCLLVKKSYLQRELDDVRALNASLEKRQEELMSSDAQSQHTQRCILKGQTSTSSLEVDIDNIVYIESIANYADVCYMQGDNLCHKTLRTTLKALREALGEDNSLVQCHRAFIVNLKFVLSIEKAPGGCQLQLFGMEKRIPVSRNNVPAVRQKLG